MLARNWRLALISMMLPVLVCPLYLFTQTGRAYGAPDTLDLQLDDPAVIRWEIINIMPGDSGTESIDLHNSGDISGYIYVWIDDIVDGEGFNPEPETGNTSEPGELSSYLRLDIVNPGMDFGRLTGTGYMQYYDLPVSMASFPRSSNQALFILDTTIAPGETLELQWQWELPLYTGNEVQGDTVSFSFYYMLSTYYTEEEEPAGPFGGGGGPPVPPTTPAATTTPAPTTTPATTAAPTTTPTATPTVEPIVPTRTYSSEDGVCVLYIPEGLNVFTDSGEEISEIAIDISASVPSPPKDYRYACRTYQITNFAGDCWRGCTGLQQSVELTVYLNRDNIPEGAEVYLVSYHPLYGWVKLGATGGLSEGKLTAWISHINLVSVIYKVDIRYVELIAPDATTQVVEGREQPDNRDLPALASLGVAVSGTVAMTALVIIERIRRHRRAKKDS